MAYKIQSGDTLSAIASKNKTDIATLQKLNPNITDPNKIQAGASLNLPDASSVTQSVTPTVTNPAVQTQLSDAESKLKTLQGTQAQAKTLGYTPEQQIQYDPNSGAMVPASSLPPTGISSSFSGTTGPGGLVGPTPPDVSPGGGAQSATALAKQQTDLSNTEALQAFTASMEQVQQGWDDTKAQFEETQRSFYGATALPEFTVTKFGQQIKDATASHENALTNLSQNYDNAVSQNNIGLANTISGLYSQYQTQYNSFLKDALGMATDINNFKLSGTAGKLLSDNMTTANNLRQSYPDANITDAMLTDVMNGVPGAMDVINKQVTTSPSYTAKVQREQQLVSQSSSTAKGLFTKKQVAAMGDGGLDVDTADMIYSAIMNGWSLDDIRAELSDPRLLDVFDQVNNIAKIVSGIGKPTSSASTGFQ